MKHQASHLAEGRFVVIRGRSWHVEKRKTLGSLFRFWKDLCAEADLVFYCALTLLMNSTQARRCVQYFASLPDSRRGSSRFLPRIHHPNRVHLVPMIGGSLVTLGKAVRPVPHSCWSNGLLPRQASSVPRFRVALLQIHRSCSPRHQLACQT